MLRSWLMIASVPLACAVTTGSRADVVYLLDPRLLLSHPHSTEHVLHEEILPDDWAADTGGPLPDFESLAIDVDWPVRRSATSAVLDRAKFEPSEEDDFEDLLEALYLEEAEAIIDLEGTWDDGLIEDETQYIGQSPALAMSAGDGLRIVSSMRGGRGRIVVPGLFVNALTPNVGLIARPDAGERADGSLRGADHSGENLYFLDWPWSVRPGRNMFYWVAGPPAFVVLAMVTMSLFTGKSKG